MRKCRWQTSLTVSLILLSFACQHRPDTQSDTKQIFRDQQRSLVHPDTVPFVISVNGGCTGFIIDTKKNIAISAQHCGVTKASKLCFLQPRLRGDDWQPSQCQYDGVVDEIIEFAPVAELDYVIFRYDFGKKRPKDLQSVRLASQDFLQSLHSEKRPLAMIGYPADAYQRTRLTSSSCVVREPQIRSLTSQTTPENQSVVDTIVQAWESDITYSGRSDYRSMREACFFIASSKRNLRPTFKEDCSVYGGNSGGPILVESSQIVVGMPASYYPQPQMSPKGSASSADACYDQYWDIYFKPHWGPRPAPSKNKQAIEIARAQIWDKLDRESSDLKDFPTAIPMHSIVAASEFLKKNPQYLADQLTD